MGDILLPFNLPSNVLPWFFSTAACCSMVWSKHNSLLSRSIPSCFYVSESQADVPSQALVCLTPDCLDLVYYTNCPYFSLPLVTVLLTQFLLWSFPAQPLSTHSNLILTTIVSQSDPTLRSLHEGLDANAEHVGDIRALSPIASMEDSVPNCLGGLISEASAGIKDLQIITVLDNWHKGDD